MRPRFTLRDVMTILFLGGLVAGCETTPYQIPESDESTALARVGEAGPVAMLDVTRSGSGERVGHATLVRGLSGIVARLQTDLALRGQAVTVWALVFNQPDACSSRPCPGSELGLANGVSLRLDGRVVRENGAGFGGRLAAGPNGITNPMGADVRFVIRTHGPVIPGRVEEQLGSANGGCDVDVTPAIPNTQGECSSVASAASTGS